MQQLFNNLMELCNAVDSSFSFKNFIRDEQTFRIFNYRLASYTDFCKPDALEARGIMFLMDDNDSNKPIRIVCRPPKKFFNLDENPITMNLDMSQLKLCMYKMDGSLISTYLYGKHGERKLGLKSKGALFSDQAVWAEQWIERPENKEFYLEVYDLALQGYTVNMEFISPRNQIVVPYEKEDLIILNIRSNQTGLILFRHDVYGKYHLDRKWVSFMAPELFDLSLMNGLKGVEGFVLLFNDGLLVKVKTEEYMVLHKTKDSVTIPRRLFECVILEATDDLRAMFKNDPLSLTRIDEMEALVVPKYNHMVSSVEKYYEENKHLARKEYAIKGQKEIEDFFGLVMNKYLGKLKDEHFKDFAIKNWKEFGIKEEVSVE